MTKQMSQQRRIALAVTTALATIALPGCTASVAPPASASAAAAQTALDRGQNGKAVELAEAAVLAAPRDAAGRALLGAAYIEAGRFVSAAITLSDALALGDTSRRTIITYALAQIAAGQPQLALETLDRWESALDPADFGLAVALAGRPQQGVHVLGNALRAGNNTAKMRQNLAYAFALQGDWRSARLMAEQDVPADQVGERLGYWAQMAMPEMFQHRVAELLSTRLAADPGQPARLALANHPNQEMMVAEAVAEPVFEAPVAVAAGGELPPVALALATPSALVAARAPVAAAPAPEPSPVAIAAAPVVSLEDRIRFVARPVVQDAPAPAAAAPAPASAVAHRAAAAPAAAVTPAARERTATPRQRAAAGFAMKPGDHRVQLGSYFSMSDAQTAWKLFQSRHPELEGAQKVITKANVKGKIYYRVAASGFARASAQEMCAIVKRGGGGCIAYAANNPLPGTIGTATRMARR